MKKVRDIKVIADLVKHEAEVKLYRDKEITLKGDVKPSATDEFLDFTCGYDTNNYSNGFLGGVDFVLDILDKKGLLIKESKEEV